MVVSPTRVVSFAMTVMLGKHNTLANACVGYGNTNHRFAINCAPLRFPLRENCERRIHLLGNIPAIRWIGATRRADGWLKD